MSPIFVRPVREQLEHDRLIRYLQGRLKRKFEVETNVGDEQVAPLKVGAATLYPDLILMSDNKLAGVIEVETGESVNNLEAMAQWVHFGKLRAPFCLYVPVGSFETARRLCALHNASVAEVWTYRGAMDGFDLVRMYHDPKAAAQRATRPSASRGAPRPPKAAKAAKAKAAKPEKSDRTAKAEKVARAPRTSAAGKGRTAKRSPRAAKAPASASAARKSAAPRAARATRTSRAGARKK